MPEAALSGEEHRYSGFLASGNDVGIFDAASRLNDYAYAGLGGCVYVIRGREESVAC